MYIYILYMHILSIHEHTNMNTHSCVLKLHKHRHTNMNTHTFACAIHHA